MKSHNHLTIFGVFSIFLMIACGNPDPNLDNKGEDELKALEIETTIEEGEIKFQEIIYVPIYSDIYVDQQNQSVLLAATLSIRNTSYKDSLFISKIDYFDTKGDMVRSYIDNVISIPPMATVNYVVDKNDDTGGPGANFIVELNAKTKNVDPIIQAVMIGQTGNKGFSFTTEGYVVKSR